MPVGVVEVEWEVDISSWVLLGNQKNIAKSLRFPEGRLSDCIVLTTKRRKLMTSDLNVFSLSLNAWRWFHWPCILDLDTETPGILKPVFIVPQGDAGSPL
jgi:hypothetical protein